MPAKHFESVPPIRTFSRAADNGTTTIRCRRRRRSVCRNCAQHAMRDRASVFRECETKMTTSPTTTLECRVREFRALESLCANNNLGHLSAHKFSSKYSQPYTKQIYTAYHSMHKHLAISLVHISKALYQNTIVSAIVVRRGYRRSCVMFYIYSIASC